MQSSNIGIFTQGNDVTENQSSVKQLIDKAKITNIHHEKAANSLRTLHAERPLTR